MVRLPGMVRFGFILTRIYLHDVVARSILKMKKRKQVKRLERRQASFKPTGSNPKHVAHKPGSQNHKKG